MSPTSERTKVVKFVPHSVDIPQMSASGTHVENRREWRQRNRLVIQQFDTHIDPLLVVSDQWILLTVVVVVVTVLHPPYQSLGMCSEICVQ